MAIREIVTRGYGNGNFLASIAEIVTRGYTINRYGTSNVRNSLIDYAGLSALVGQRIYRNKLPDNPVYPCILYRAAEEPENTLAGRSHLIHRVYEFELYGTNFEELEQVSSQLRAAMIDGPFEAVLTDLNDEQYYDDVRVHSVFLDYSIWQ